MRLSTLLILACPLTVSADDPTKKHSLVGTWTVVSANDEGRDATEELKKEIEKLVLTKKEFIVHNVRNNVIDRSTYTLYPKNPTWIDFRNVKADRLHRGLFKVEKDKLTFCVSDKRNGPRPTSFTPGNDVHVLVLKRVKTK